MIRAEAEAILARAGAGEDAAFPLFEAVIACAVHEDPSRDPAAARDLMDQAVDQLKDRLRSSPPAAALADTLAGDFRFSGDMETYDHPDNADVLTVCARRKGLPVALGIIWLEVARRCGLALSGVDFPGHFLLRLEAADGVAAIDPFTDGRLVPPPELVRRALHAGLTPALAGRLDALMAPAADRSVLVRLQNNLHGRAVDAEDHPRAERAALRRALIYPAEPRLWLDVAAAREAQGALSGALEALDRATGPNAADAARTARMRIRRRLN